MPPLRMQFYLRFGTLRVQFLRIKGIFLRKLAKLLRIKLRIWKKFSRDLDRLKLISQKETNLKSFLEHFYCLQILISHF